VSKRVSYLLDSLSLSLLLINYVYSVLILVLSYSFFNVITLMVYYNELILSDSYLIWEFYSFWRL